MLPRLLLLLIPILTLTIGQRWFTYYASLLIAAAVAQLTLLFLLTDEIKEAFASFGIEVVLAYIGANLLLLALRYWFIRRARARILKLPAPKE